MWTTPSQLLRIALITSAFLKSWDQSPLCRGVIRLRSWQDRAERSLGEKTRTDEVQTAEGTSMAVTYYVALPFIRTDDGTAPGEAQECQSEAAAIRRAEGMSRDPANAGRLHSSVQAIRTLVSFRTRLY